MDRPTGADLQEWSKLDFAELEYSDDAALDMLVEQACVYVEHVTGRGLSSPPVGSVGGVKLVEMPDDLVALAQQAVRMRTEQVALQAQPDYVETAADDLVSSFSAGAYSETRRDAPRKDAKRMNSWAALQEILLLLCTPDRYDFWLAWMDGVHAPAFAVSEVAWGYPSSPFGAGVPVDWDLPW